MGQKTRRRYEFGLVDEGGKRGGMPPGPPFYNNLSPDSTESRDLALRLGRQILAYNTTILR